MTKILTSLLSRIYSRCSYLAEMLDFIQADSAFKKREELLKKLNITARQAPEQLTAYRNAIMDLQVKWIVADYILAKHPFSRWCYRRMEKRVYKVFEKAAKTKVDNDGAK